jgi:3-isopropylmalate dehydrogenase
MVTATIAVLPGDGIGPEVIDAALLVLDAVAEASGHRFNREYARIGGVAIDTDGEPLPTATAALCRRADAVLLGAVGGPKWDGNPGTMRPERGLLGLRKALELFANIRPVAPHPAAIAASPIKPERLEGVDLVVVRELTGGSYFGEKRREGSGTNAVARDEYAYSAEEIARVARVAFEYARARRRHVTSVDKANVLETSRLWREVVTGLARTEYPDVELEHMLVDACAMHLISRPADFDVIVTENMFGDILTDEASVLAGSIGVLPSASLGAHRNARGFPIGLYEPIHGSAPAIAGFGIANPVGTILSVAMMLRTSFGLTTEATAIERATSDVLARGIVTSDLAASSGPAVGTAAMARAVADAVGSFLIAGYVIV